jgi:DNA-binding LytR/AlgR family response regulator
MLDDSKIKCLIVDDEPPAWDVIKNYISFIPSLQFVASCDNALEALSFLKQHHIDLIFLDIQMPQILGTDFIRTLKNPPKIIFTTAHRKFAVEGFELDAVDYLLKPISFERFLKAVNRVLETTLQSTKQEDAPDTRKRENSSSFIHFRADRKMVKVPLEEILYIESLKDYIKVVTKTKTIITKQSISSLEENLPGPAFIRIHRSYIVALDKIESYSTELIEIAKQTLPISRMYRHEVEKVLNPG